MLVGLFLQYQRAVDHQVVVGDVLRLANLVDGLAVHPVELTVPDGDVVHRIGQLGVVVTHNHDAIFRLLAGHVLHRHVTNGGVESATAHLARLVVGVDFQYSLLALSYGDVAHVDVLDDATATGVGLDAQHTVQRGRVHLAVLDIHILTATADFRSDDHATVSVLHLTATDDNILRGGASELALATLATVVVTARFDGDAVVARVEETVLNQHSVARLWVAAVAVGTVVDDVHASHGDVFRQQGMDDPEGRAQQGDIFDEDTLALVQVDHLGAQAVARTVASLVHGHPVFSLFQQLWATGFLPLVYGHALLESEFGGTHPGPPCLTAATTIDGAFTGNGDVLLLIGIDQRAEVPAVQSLPAGRHDGVELWQEGKLQHSTLFHHQVHAVLQLDGSRQELLSGRDDHASTALLRALVDGLLDSLLVLGCRSIGLGSEFGDDIVFRCKLRHADALLYLAILLLVPAIGIYGNNSPNEQHHGL